MTKPCNNAPEIVILASDDEDEHEGHLHIVHEIMTDSNSNSNIPDTSTIATADTDMKDCDDDDDEVEVLPTPSSSPARKSPPPTTSGDDDGSRAAKYRDNCPEKLIFEGFDTTSSGDRVTTTAATASHGDDYTQPNDDEESESDEPPIVSLAMPIYEQTFRACIIKPISSISKQGQTLYTGGVGSSSGDDDDDDGKGGENDLLSKAELTLSDARKQLFPILQAVYLEARSIYASDSDSSSLPTPLYMPGPSEDHAFLQGKFDTFADPTAEEITKTKLLPQTIRALLKLGFEKYNGHRKNNSSFIPATSDNFYDSRQSSNEPFLTVAAEDMVACIFLDYIGLITSILGLYNEMIERENEQQEDNDVQMCDNNAAQTNLENDTTGTDRVVAPSAAVETKKSVPNILVFLGSELLSVTARILASEACYVGYSQTLCTLRSENFNGKLRVNEIVNNYLPAFYQSHPFKDNCNTHLDQEFEKNNSNEAFEFLSPLRSGEWREYYELYHPAEIRSKGTTNGKETKEVDKVNMEDEIRTSGHLVAAARYFVLQKGLDSLTHLISCDDATNWGAKNQSDEIPIMDRVGVMYVYLTFDIFRSISFLSSSCHLYETNTNDCLNMSSLSASFQKFRIKATRFIDSLQIGCHLKSLEERQNILNMLSSIEGRSLAENEWNAYSDTNSQRWNICPLVEFTFSESCSMKLSILWRFLVGSSSSQQSDWVAVAPSLQCQILGLNELTAWLNSLENYVRENKAHFMIQSKDGSQKNNGVADNYNKNMVGNVIASDNEKDQNSKVQTSVIDIDLIKDNNDAHGVLDLNKITTVHSEVGDDNGSTEVCCNSTGSVSSKESPEFIHELEGSINSVDSSADAWSKPNKDTTTEIKNSTDPSTSQESTKNLTTFRIFNHAQKRLDTIVSQLTSNDYPILEHLFSPNALHPELLKRTLPLLQFLARQSKVKKKDIKLMWDASGFGSFPENGSANELDNNRSRKAPDVVQHESVTSAIFELIFGLVNMTNSWTFVGVETFSYIVELFSQVKDCNRWTPQSLSIIESIIHCSIDGIVQSDALKKRHDDNFVPPGLELLWSLSHDEGQDREMYLPRQIQNLAFNMLMRIVERILTLVQDEVTDPKRVSPSDHENTQNGLSPSKHQMNVLPQTPPILSTEHSSLNTLQEHFSSPKVSLGIQRLQTTIIQRIISTIDLKGVPSCPTATIRLMLFILNFVPLQSNDKCPPNASNKISELLTVEDIFRHNDVFPILIKETNHFADDLQCVLRTYSNNASNNHSERQSFLEDFFQSTSDNINYRHKLLHLAFIRCIDLHLATIKNTLLSSDGIIPVHSDSKKRKRGPNAANPDESERVSKRKPALIDTDECELVDSSSEERGLPSSVETPNDQQFHHRHYLLDFSRLLPTPSDVAQLWTRFISMSLPARIKDHTFNMIYDLLTQDFGQSNKIRQWKEEVAQTIYPLCCKLNLTEISEAGYKLLIYCLGYTNVAKENFVLCDTIHDEQRDQNEREYSNILLGLSYGQESKQFFNPCSLFAKKDPFVTEIANEKISGLPILWTIIQEGEDEKVALMSMIYMAVLNTYTNINATQQVSFVKQCMAGLNTNSFDNKTLKKKKRMLSLIRLYTEYAMRSSNSKSLQQSEISHGFHVPQVISALHTEEIELNPPYNINVQILEGPKFEILCKLGTNTTVADIHESVEKYTSEMSPKNETDHQHNKEFALEFNRHELPNKEATLGSLKILEHATIHCLVLENEKDVKRDKLLPLSCKTMMPGINALVSPPCIESFFSLFSSNTIANANANGNKLEDWKELRAPVWDLLQLLPTEPRLKHCFESIRYHHHTSCDMISWERWLPTPKPGDSMTHFQLLYGLQLVETHALHKEEWSPCVNSEKKNVTATIDNDVFKSQDKKDSSSLDVSNKRSFAIGKDDEFIPNKRPNNALEKTVDSTTEEETNKSSVDSKQWCENFVALGGLNHLISLFMSIDLSLFFNVLNEGNSDKNIVKGNGQHTLNGIRSTDFNNNDDDIEALSMLVACTNKCLFMIRVILLQTSTIGPNQSNGAARRMNKINEFESLKFFDHLLNMIHWVVGYQTFGQRQKDSHSTTPNKKHQETFRLTRSMVEVGGSVAIQCLFLIKMIEKEYSITNKGCSLILEYLDLNLTGDQTAYSNKLSNAIAASIVESPTAQARSLALSVFKSLFSLNPDMEETSGKESSPSKLNLLALSVLISVLPIGRRNDFNIISRMPAIIDMIANCMSSLWKHTSKKLIENSVERFLSYHQSHSDISQVPTINGIEHLGNFFSWIIQEVISLDRREYRVPSTVTDLDSKFQRESSYKAMVDHYLVGLVSLMRDIIQIIDNPKAQLFIGRTKVSESQGFLEFLLDQCAFPQIELSESQRSLFVSTQTRDSSLNLLRCLCKGCEGNLNRLLSSILDHFLLDGPREDLIQDWSVDLTSKQKNITGYVGMKNQGATCYLNSLLQQFFHTPTLRHGLLSCNLNEVESNGEEYTLLHEMQLLFGNLLLSEKRDYDTSSFVKSIRGYDGNTIRPGEQQDVDEFFNLFCDRLETALKPLPQKRLLHDVFGGQVSHLITCQQCNYSSERVEDFLSISLDVKGKKSILESFEAYIQGEVLDGSNKYLCSKCNEKQDSIKRCCIKALPNVLICHLKRFTYDLETMRKVKVNDRCEYPMYLNLKKFTKEGISGSLDDSQSFREDDYYKYTLRGVLVHTGTADSGHYYSLAQVRKEEKGHERTDEGQWFCFNDAIVTPFDPNTLEANTFGGSILTEKSNLRQESRSVDMTKSYSAYLLIYDREVNYSFDEQVTSSPCSDREATCYSDLKDAQWNERICHENSRFIKDQKLFSPAYSYFITDLSKMCMDLNEEKSKSKIKPIQLLTFYLIETLAHGKDRKLEIENTVSLLSKWYSANLEACKWFLELLSTTHVLWVDKMLLHCYVPETRAAFSRLLKTIFKKMAPLERSLYYEVLNDRNDADFCQFDLDDDILVRSKGCHELDEYSSRLGRLKYWKSKSLLARFIGTCLLDKIEGCETHWRRFDQLFECISAFASCGHDESIFLIRCGLVLRLVDLYLGKKSAIPQKSLLLSPSLQQTLQDNDPVPKAQMGDKFKKPNFYPLLQLLGTLVRSVMIVPDDSMTDSESSDTDESSTTLKERDYYDLEGSYMIPTYRQVCNENKRIFELPQRDTWQLSRIEVFEKMLDEPTSYGSSDSIQKSYYFLRDKNSESTAAKERENCDDIANLISDIACHICYRNFDITLRNCAHAKKLLNDRKAEKFVCALSVLTSMLHISDKHTKERIPCVLTGIFDGIKNNSSYEKETIYLVGALTTELLKIPKSKYGSRREVLIYQDMFERIDDIVYPLLQENNSAVKQSAISFLCAFLCQPDEPFEIRTNNDITGSKDISSQSPAQTSDCTESPDLSRDSNSEEVNCDRAAFIDEDTVKDKIFSILKDYFDVICGEIENQSNLNTFIPSGGHIAQERRKFYSIFHWVGVEARAFAEYFKLLRICLSGPKVEERREDDEKWMSEVSSKLLRILWKIDEEGRQEKRPSADITKGEIILLYERLLEIEPILCMQAFLVNDEDEKGVGKHNGVRTDPCTKMVELFVTSSEKDTDYNNRYMTHYYQTLLLLASLDEKLFHQLLFHDNWRWALRAFVLGRASLASGALYDTILNGTVKYVEEDAEFRKIIMRELVKSVGKGSSARSLLEQDRLELGSFKLLLGIFESEKKESNETGPCISHFVGENCDGINKLNFVLQKSLSTLLQPDAKTPPPTQNVLEILCLTLQCMFISLDSFGIGEIKNIVRNCWSKLDKTLEEIKNRTDEEWEPIYSVKENAKMTVMKIIMQATEIKNILASVEALLPDC